jgi:hypothetical protein
VVDFDDDLAMGVQKPGQSNAVAAGAFHRPHQPWTRGVLEGEVEQCLVALAGRVDLGLADHGAGRADQRSGMDVAMSVHTDDGVELVCHHQAGLPRWRVRSGVGLG